MRTYLKAVVILGTMSMASPSNAQILQIGPLGGVRVRVPFVNVDVGPFGGTRVQAPFVDIATPGTGYYIPRPVTVGRYYAPGYTIARPYVPSPIHSSTTSPYEATALDERWVEPMREGESKEAFQLRLLEQLTVSWARLDHELGNSRNGESLRTYLKIPQMSLPGSQHLSVAELDSAIVNYDALNRTIEFIVIARLPSFQETRSHLHAIRSLAGNPSDETSVLEEISPERQAF